MSNFSAKGSGIFGGGRSCNMDECCPPKIPDPIVVEADMQFQAAAATLDPVSRDFYQSAVRYLQQGSIPFLVGGAYSFARYTGLERHTKDFDIFVRPVDCKRVLRALAGAGYEV